MGRRHRGRRRRRRRRREEEERRRRRRRRRRMFSKKLMVFLVVSLTGCVLTILKQVTQLKIYSNQQVAKNRSIYLQKTENRRQEKELATAARER